MELQFEILINEYLGKVKDCDSCMAECFCTLKRLRHSRKPQDYCNENIKKYLKWRKNLFKTTKSQT